MSASANPAKAPCFSPADSALDDVRCARCEVVRPAPRGSGALHLRFPIVFSLRKFQTLADRQSWSFVEKRGVLTIDIPENALREYLRVLAGVFTAVERSSIRTLFIESGREPDLAAYLEADSLEKLNAYMRLDDVAAVIDGGGLTAAFQPIVDATNLDIFAYEGLLRLPASCGIAGPAEFFRIARNTDTLPNADLAARRAIISGAAAQAFDGKLFINFMPSSIYDAASCLRSTIAALDELGVAHDRIVFEVVESDEIVDVAHLLATLAVYRKAGFGVALDDLGSGFASLNLLHALRPDYIKLDLALVRDVDRDAFKAMLAQKLIEAALGLGMKVIAEGVERSGEWDWLREHGATYVQGYLFGRPQALVCASVEAPLRTL